MKKRCSLNAVFGGFGLDVNGGFNGAFLNSGPPCGGHNVATSAKALKK